jgi:hypothetical protein
LWARATRRSEDDRAGRLKAWILKALRSGKPLGMRASTSLTRKGGPQACSCFDEIKTTLLKPLFYFFNASHNSYWILLAFSRANLSLLIAWFEVWGSYMPVSSF